MNIFGDIDNFQVEIRNLEGRLMLKTNSKRNINIQDFLPGVYFLQVYDGIKLYFDKVIKE